MNISTIKRDYWPNQEWRTADPASLGMSSKKFTELDHLVKSQYRNINGIVIVRKGHVVFERYYNGHGPLDTHNVASVTKSITSALIGIAIDAGYIKSVDQKILDFFPNYIPGVNDIQKRTLTIRHLLTMTAPFAWKYKMGHEPLDRLRRQPDWVTYILNLLGQNGQIGKFQYCTAGTHLLSAIITRTTGLCAREFANDRLFRPLGVQEIPDHEIESFSLDNVFGKNVTGWGKDPNGNTTGGWGLTISPRDMARFGFLYLNRGIWDGKQIISEAWIDESTALNSNGNGYGYLWWIRKDDTNFIYSALGSGGNVISCIPGKDLVVAIASSIISKPRDSWLLIEKCILPAIQN